MFLFSPDSDYLAAEQLAIHGVDAVRRLSGTHLWTRVARAADVIEAHGREGLILVLGRSTENSIAAFVAAIALGRPVAYFPPPSPRQDAAYYIEQQRVAIGRIAPALLLIEDTALAAAIAEVDTGGATVGSIAGLRDDADLEAATDFATRFLAALQNPSTDPLFIQHSSGTTGIKKAVEIGRAALMEQLRGYWSTVAAATAAARPHVGSWLPLYHDMGLIATLMLPLMSGSRMSLIDPFDWVEEPASLFRLIDRDRPDVCYMPNFAFRHLTRLRRTVRGVDASSVKAWINCSEPCRLADVLAFEAAYADVGVAPGSVLGCYAMAETVFAVSQGAPGPRRALRVPPGLKPGDDARAAGAQLIGDADAHPAGERAYLSSGAALPGLDVAVMVDGSRVDADGIYGEITIGGDMVFGGYRHLTAAESSIADDGRYATGDMGVRIDGEWFVVGRTKEIVIVNGKNIYAGDVEDVLNGVAGVKGGRVVAFGIENARIGSEELIVVAERDAAGDVPADALRRALIAEVARTFPITAADVRVVEDRWLVKSTSGKISRNANRDKYLATWPRD